MLIDKPRPASKSFLRFLDRMRVTADHMRVVNKALGVMQSRKTEAGFSDRDRQIANHAISRNAEIALQFAYGHFIAYIKSILREMYRKKPLEIVNKSPSTLAYHEIVKLGSYEAICNFMVEQVFKSIEGKRNTRALLNKILDKTNVSITEDVMATALMYIEMRHLIVHNNGKVDQDFADRYGTRLNVEANQTLKGNIGNSKKALKAIANLCLEMDQGLITGGFIDAVAGKKVDKLSVDRIAD